MYFFNRGEFDFFFLQLFCFLEIGETYIKVADFFLVLSFMVLDLKWRWLERIGELIEYSMGNMQLVKLEQSLEFVEKIMIGF